MILIFLSFGVYGFIGCFLAHKRIFASSGVCLYCYLISAYLSFILLSFAVYCFWEDLFFFSLLLSRFVTGGGAKGETEAWVTVGWLVYFLFFGVHTYICEADNL